MRAQLDAFLEETIRLWTDEQAGFAYWTFFAASVRRRKRRKHLAYCQDVQAPRLK